MSTTAPEGACTRPSDHDWYEAFLHPKEGGPGYQTTCLRCGITQGPVMTIDQTIAKQNAR